MVLRKLDSNLQKNETWPLSHAIHKDKLQMDERLRCETGIHPATSLTLATATFFMTHLQREEKQKKKWTCGTSSDKKLMHIQGNSQKKLRGSSWNGRRYLQMTLQIKDWYPRSTKNLSNSIRPKQIIKWREDMNRHFSTVIEKESVHIFCPFYD